LLGFLFSLFTYLFLSFFVFKENFFLELLEPEILKRKLTTLTAEITHMFVEHYKGKKIHTANENKNQKAKPKISNTLTQTQTNTEQTKVG
jgi:hypothetical protein